MKRYTYAGPAFGLLVLLAALFAAQSNAAKASAVLRMPGSNYAPCSPTWHYDILPSPPTGWYSMYGLSALSSSDIWAVGEAAGGTSQPPPVLHWNGSAWADVALPTLPGLYSMLHGVAAVSSTDVWAVGFDEGVGGRQMLMLRWDGTSWSQVTDLPDQGLGQLLDITAVAQDDIWAVGSRPDLSTGGTNTALLHWDGTQWSLVPSPDPFRLTRPSTIQNSLLWSVTANGHDNAWAAGQFNDGNGDLPFLEHWDGTQWSIVSTPEINPGDHLIRVVAPGPNDAWAMGYRDVAPGERYPLALHWDGSAWNTVPTPQIPLMTYYSTIGVGAAASSSKDVWLVSTAAGTPQWQSMILHWDGTIWTRVETSNLPLDGGALFAVAEPSPGDVWTLGTTTQAVSGHTIGLHYANTCFIIRR